MSRLWPERVTAGLFPGHCWLQRGTAVASQDGDFTSGDQMLAALEAMLDTQEKPLGKGARVQLLVSDSVAAIMPLPWQDLLASPEELRTYANAAFEQRGIALDDGWLVQTGFRHFRATGLAYAVRRDWMAQLLELLAARQLRLASVLPVSAAAYWRMQAVGSGKQSILLSEPGRVTAMVGQGARLQDLDVQPVTGPLDQAVARLLKRVTITHGAIAHLGVWQAQAKPATSLSTAVSACLPDAAVTPMSLQAWR